MTYLLSIEDRPFHSFRDGFHLGTDLKLAKQLAAERFHGRLKAGMPTVSVAVLDQKGMVVDVYDGQWSSEL